MKSFGVSNFSELLPQNGVSSGWESHPENTPAPASSKDTATIIAEEIAVLQEIFRRTIPVAHDESGTPRYASKGEFNDIKESIRQELFAPKLPNVVTQDDFLGALSAITQQMSALAAKVESIAVPVEVVEPAKARRSREKKEEATDAEA